MLEKTIKQILTKKVQDWINHVDDPKIKEIISNNLVITGGCFTSCILNENINDFDCYFKTKEAAKKVARYYIDKFNEKHPNQKNKLGYPCKVMLLDGGDPDEEVLNYFGIKDIHDSQSVMVDNTPPERLKIIFPSDGIVGDLEAGNASEELGEAVDRITEIDETEASTILEQEKEKYSPVFISSNAITLSNDIQIIVRFYGEPDKLHETFDFVHTEAYATFKPVSTKVHVNELCIPKQVYEHTINKTLKYTSSKYPLCSLFRIRKFINRGWTINAGQILKIAMDLNKLDLTDINVLEDQLIGVDSLYFMQLIRIFRAKSSSDPNWTLSTSYLMSVVDKIF